MKKSSCQGKALQGWKIADCLLEEADNKAETIRQGGTAHPAVHWVPDCALEAALWEQPAPQLREAAEEIDTEERHHLWVDARGWTLAVAESWAQSYKGTALPQREEPLGSLQAARGGSPEQ